MNNLLCKGENSKFKMCSKASEWLTFGKCQIWGAAVQFIKDCYTVVIRAMNYSEEQMTSKYKHLSEQHFVFQSNKHTLSQHSIYSISYVTAYTLFLNNHQVTYSVPTFHTKSF
jgi:hypothetical protein